MIPRTGNLSLYYLQNHCTIDVCITYTDAKSDGLRDLTTVLESRKRPEEKKYLSPRLQALGSVYICFSVQYGILGFRKQTKACGESLPEMRNPIPWCVVLCVLARVLPFFVPPTLCRRDSRIPANRTSHRPQRGLMLVSSSSDPKQLRTHRRRLLHRFAILDSRFSSRISAFTDAIKFAFPMRVSFHLVLRFVLFCLSHLSNARHTEVDKFGGVRTNYSSPTTAQSVLAALHYFV